MAKTYKGLTIKLGADTTNLQKSLKDINSQTKQLQSELRQVNTALKLDPANTELLKQKFDILSLSVEATKNKLQTLQSAEQQLKDANQKGTLTDEQFRAYNRELERTKINLQAMEAEQAKVSTGGQSMQPATDSVQRLNTEVQRTSESTKELQADAKKLAQTLVKGFALALTALSAVIAKSTQAGASFEEAMSQVVATMGIDNTAKDYEILADKAKELGATTKYSATQAAGGLELLAQAGYETKEQLTAVPAILDLAASGGIDLAQSAEIATTSMSALGLAVDQLREFADKTAVAAQATNSTVASMGEGFTASAGNAQILAGGLTETSVALGLLADNGTKGAEGGNSLRQIILNLTNPVAEAAAKMQELGVSAFYADGSMKPLNETFEQFDQAMAGFSDKQKSNALGKIFDARQLKSAKALLSSYGDEWDELTTKINNSDGAAEKMADTMNDNLKGDVTLLKSALEGLGITVEESFSGAFRDAIQSASSEITKLNTSLTKGQMSEKLQEITKGFELLIKQTTDFAINSALPATIDGFGWILTNGQTIKAIVVDIGVAFATWKVAKIFKNISTEFTILSTKLATATTKMQAFNAIASSGTLVTLGITAAFSVINGLISHVQKLREEEAAARRERAKDAQDSAEKLQGISDLTTEYEKLKGISEKTSDQEQRFSDLQDQITQQLGTRAGALDNLKQGTEEYNKALDETISAEQAIQTSKIYAGLEDTKKAITEVADFAEDTRLVRREYFDGIISDLESPLGNIITSMFSTEELKEFASESDGYLNMSIATYFKYQDEVEKTTNEITRLYQAGKAEEANALQRSEAYQAMNTAIAQNEEPINNYLQQMAQLAEYTYAQANGIPETIAQQKELQELFVEMLGINPKYSGSLDGIVSNYLKTYNSTSEVVDETEELKKTLVDVTMLMDDYKTAIQTVSDSNQVLSSAMSEMQNSGQLSTDTITKLVESGYSLALQWDEETGACTLLKDKVDELTVAKYDKIKADLQERQINLQEQYDAESKSLENLQKNINSVTDAEEYRQAVAKHQQSKQDLSDATSYANAYDSATGTSSYAQQEATSMKDVASQQLAEIEHMYSVGELSAKDYYSALREVDKQYYESNSEYLSEHYSLTEKIYSGLKKVYEDNFETEKDWLDYSLAIGEITTETYYNNLQSLINKYYAGQYEYSDKYAEYQKNINEGLLNAKKQALEDEKSAIQSVNEESQKAIDIEKAKIELQNAQNNLIRTYSSDRGIYDTTDISAVKDAQAKIDELISQQQIDAIDRNIKALEDNTSAYTAVAPTKTASYFSGSGFDDFAKMQTGFDNILSKIQSISIPSAGDLGTKQDIKMEFKPSITLNGDVSQYSIDQINKSMKEQFDQCMQEFLTKAKLSSANR